ncbi:orotidine-5'-phosphate decarboxylase [archaeon]|nr:orotidine-5'-phosphate decarboxylase [archaeon]
MESIYRELTETEKQSRDLICLPLDNLDTIEEFESLVKELSPYVGMFKVGMASYTRFGPKAIEIIRKYDSEVFLDLKYYDIPNTLNDVSRAAAELGVYMFNVHASGGKKMMRDTVNSVKEKIAKTGGKMPKLLGVTILTSFDEATYLQTVQAVNPKLDGIDFDKYIEMAKADKVLQNEFKQLLVDFDLKDIIKKQVYNLAHLSEQIGLDGVVCSADDLKAIKDTLPKSFMYVTPGIKGPNTLPGPDQNIDRVFTPGNAIGQGSTILVVGRAITDPRTEEQREMGVEITPQMRIDAAYDVVRDAAEYLESVN